MCPSQLAERSFKKTSKFARSWRILCTSRTVGPFGNIVSVRGIFFRVEIDSPLVPVILSSRFPEDSFQSQKPRSASDQAIDDRIRDFERAYGQVLSDYARGEGEPYPAWIPPHGPFETPKSYADFVKALALPCPSSNNVPNLLLHELGNSDRAEAQPERLDSIYQSGRDTYVELSFTTLLRTQPSKVCS